jgi:hypothetical protein
MGRALMVDPGPAADGAETGRGQTHSLSKTTRQRLYATFAGGCAFPDCPYQHQLPDGVTILEIAHIRAANPGGPRFSPPANEELANDDSNLILLCPVHHRLVDENPSDYSAETLFRIRESHLNVVAASPPPSNLSGPPHPREASRLERAIGIWERERQNSSEEFWHQLFKSQPELVATNGGAFVLNSKCYIGGKAVDNRGGNVVDFLLQQKGNAVLVEIKTPQARLLGSQYRSVYPPSHELAGAVTQLLSYRTSLQQELASLTYRSTRLRAINPQAFLLIGDLEDESFSREQEESFELFRSCLKDVVIQTYDALFDGVRSLSAWKEPFSPGKNCQ